MSSSKYSEATVKIITETLSVTGSDRSAWESGGISRSTFYAWQKRYEEFALRVKTARYDFLTANMRVFRVLALNEMYDTLRHGVVQTKKTTVKELTEVPTDDGSPPKMKLMTRSETTVVSNLGVPQWLIEKIMGKTVDEIDAVNKLIEAEWFDPHLVAELPREIELFNDRVREVLTQNVLGNK